MAVVVENRGVGAAFVARPDLLRQQAALYVAALHLEQNSLPPVNTVHAQSSHRFGVFDLMTEFCLTMDEAPDVSDHLPVWAEFSACESGVAGPPASRPGMPVR